MAAIYKDRLRAKRKAQRASRKKQFVFECRDAYKRGIAGYFKDRALEIEAGWSYRLMAFVANMSGGGFFRAYRGASSLQLDDVLALMDAKAFQIDIFVDTLREMARNPHQFRAVGLAAAVARLAKLLKCVPSWTDAEDPVCLEEDGAVLYAYMELTPKSDWPSNFRKARSIAITQELADAISRRAIELTPAAISPSEIEGTEDKIAFIERIVRNWGYAACVAYQVLLPVWSVTVPARRAKKTA